jgi:hypothetical protein
MTAVVVAWRGGRKRRFAAAIFAVLLVHMHALPIADERPALGREGGPDPGSATTPPPARKRGIVFTPPFGGVRMEALKKDREIVHIWDWICDRDTNGSWVTEWLPEGGWKSLLQTPCLIENMAMPPPKGVALRYIDSYQACMYLSDDRTIHSTVWGEFSEFMTGHGWKEGETLFALPMDWRVGPSSYSRPGGEFERFKALIERAVAASGGPVSLVCVSCTVRGVFAMCACCRIWTCAYVCMP